MPRDGSLTALFLPVPCLFRIRLDIRLEIDAALSALQFSGNQGLRRGQDRDVAGGKGYGAEQRSRFARTAVKGELDRKGPVREMPKVCRPALAAMEAARSAK